MFYLIFLFFFLLLIRNLYLSILFPVIFQRNVTGLDILRIIIKEMVSFCNVFNLMYEK